MKKKLADNLEKKYRILAGPINGNKFATSQILKKPVEVVKGRILAGWAQKSPEPWGETLGPPLSIQFFERNLKTK